jgi:hypothetical protein
MDPAVHKLEQQVRDLQKQVAFLQGCCQQLFANDQAFIGAILASQVCLLATNPGNSSILGALSGMPVAIAPITSSAPQMGFAIQRIPGSFGV